jgi:hypothetical protein
MERGLKNKFRQLRRSIYGNKLKELEYLRSEEASIHISKLRC